jgi:hypothetical protein
MKLRWKIVLGIVIVFAALIVCGLVTHRIPVRAIVISPETTWITGPLNSDGTVDYVRYVETQAAQGVTVDNNAAVILVEVLGLESLCNPAYHEAAAEAMGMELSPRVIRGQWTNYHESHGSLAEAESSPPTWTDIVDEVHGPWAEVEHPALAAWLRTNGPALDAIVVGMARERFYIPRLATHDPSDMVHTVALGVADARSIAIALRMRALLRLESDDLAGAWSDLLAAWRLGRYLQASPHFLLYNMVGLSIERDLTPCYSALLCHPDMTGAMLRRIQRDLAAMPAQQSFADAVKFELCLPLDIAQMLYRGDALPEGPFCEGIERIDRNHVDWNHLMRRLNVQARVMDAAYRLDNWPDMRTGLTLIATDHQAGGVIRDGESVIPRWKYPLGWVYAPYARRLAAEALGDVLLGYGLGASVGTAEFWHKRASVEDLADIAVAVRLYQLETGAWPMSLELLADDYIDELPTDFFGGVTYRHRVVDGVFVIYSVGPNGVDDGGLSDGMSDADLAALGIASRDDIPDDADDIAVVLGSVDAAGRIDDTE